MFRASNRYGELNGFDLLKLLALLTMIIDHAGHYLLHDAGWLRAVGRMAFPLFLFLVGYSGAWKIKPGIVVWALLITACALLLRYTMLPLNILFSIIAVRLLMPLIVARVILSARSLTVLFVLCICSYPFFSWLDYSSFALLFAVSGHLLRVRPREPLANHFLLASMAAYFLLETVLVFAFDLAPWLCVCAGLALDASLMLHISLEPLKSRWLPGIARRTLAWSARNTLPLYGLHLIALMIMHRLQAF